jgi:hypothetical protein
LLVMSTLSSGEVLSDRSMVEVHVYLRRWSKGAFVSVDAVTVMVLVGRIEWSLWTDVRGY